MPTVSVILPFYNRRATLPRCIESVLGQTFADWEVVAVDDCSSDDSAALLEGYRDPRIRIVRHPVNQGAGPARDSAMAAAEGQWFAFLDSDDQWLPEKLAAQMAAIERSGRQLCTCAFELHRNGQICVLPKPMAETLEKSLHRECTFGFGTTLLISRQLAQALGPFDPQLPRHEDWDWILRAAEQGEELALVEEPLARVYCVDQPQLDRFVPSTERFLSRHAQSFQKFGEAYQRRVLAHHYESVASMAYEQRRYRIGHRYLIKSYVQWPWRSPLALAALPLGVIDGLFGTRLIQWGADLQRALFRREEVMLP